jgi:iron complex outermembrane recepter protein
MNSNPKLSYAIAAILSGTSVGISHAATATDASDSESIQEITVTAQRRSEAIQDVPITVQAITGDQLKQLNITTFDDLIKYTPNVTYSGNNPGGGNIYMRGLSSGAQGNQSGSTTAPFPNVALYLDDQSMQYPERNVDVYMVDMERVEVLEGPQGTLFGGGAQAGAIRYITNKPKLNVTEGNANASWGTTAGGDDNSSANATLNLPLIADHLAVRAVIFTERRGGYIDNVPGTISFPGSPVATNGPLVGSETNPVTYNGMRLSALYQINDDWNVLIQQNFQNMEADGYFAQYPISSSGTPLAPYQIDAFEPAYDKDRYESTAWTVNGKFGNILSAVYTGSYLVRHIDQQADYSNYLTSPGGQYYACTTPTGLGGGPKTCYAPVGSWNDRVENTHQSHEVRFTTNEDFFVRGLFGAFWESFVIRDQMNFNYLAIPQCGTLADPNSNLNLGVPCTSAVGPIPGTTASSPGLRTGTDTAFGEDAQRGYTQTAFFASVDVDIIPKVLTLTGGIRHFEYHEFETGSEFYSSTGSNNLPDGACTAAGGCGFGMNLHKTESGDKVRGNITWHITPDIMAYYTYSQGFRPGGFNRTASIPTVSLAAEGAYACAVPLTTNNGAPFCSKPDKTTDQFFKPVGYDSDNLINNEIGFKTEWFQHRLIANLSLYKMDWSNVQLSLFDPVNLGNTTFDINGPTYEVKGVELQLVARPIEGLTLQGSSSWNSSNQTNAPCLRSGGTAVKPGNPTPAGDCITQINGIAYTNPYGVLNTSPAFSPPLSFNVRARYDMNLGDYKPFAMVGANHIGSQRNQPASFPTEASPLCSPIPTTTHCQYTMPGYTSYDAGIGVAKDNWTAQLTGSNLTNVDASVFTSSAQYIKSEVPLRPRVLTLGFSYKF